jgi:peptide/nickel transport system substrate-binding protein
MREKAVFSIVVVLLITAGMLFAGGAQDEGSGEATTSGAQSADAWQGVDLGYYNLGDYVAETGQKIESFNEAPMLAARVASGELPALEDRLPKDPLVVVPWEEIGQYGGTLHFTAINVSQDWKLRHINNAHLIQMKPNSGFDMGGTLAVPEDLRQPGILESWSTSADGKTFTATIREGLKWSDGVPVTTEDVAFRINDVLKHPEIYPVPATWLNWGGTETKFEVIDDYTFRFVFGRAYGSFVETEVMVWHHSWLYFIAPSHFLKPYHKDYADADELLATMKTVEFESMSDWGTFYSDVLNAAYGIDAVSTPRSVGLDIDEPFPTLDAFIVTEDLGEANFLMERNPYYHMVDPAGNQLPYIDYYRRDYAENMELVNMNIISGKTDLQGYSTRIEDYPLLVDNKDAGNYNLLPSPAFVDQLIIYPISLVHEDPRMEAFLQNKAFRRALSLALDRNQYKESMFMGFGEPANASARPASPFFERSHMDNWAAYDPEQAKNLLDEIDLVDRDGDGWRDFKDGERFVLPFDYFIITGATTPSAEFAKRYWEDIGISVKVRQIDVGLFFELKSNRKYAVTTWWLGGSGMYYPSNWLNWLTAPTEWRTWLNTGGEEGEEPIEFAKLLWTAHDNLDAALTMEDKYKYLKEIWDLNADAPMLIGTVYGVPQPFVYSQDLSNISRAEAEGFSNVTILDSAHQWYFKNPDRR